MIVDNLSNSSSYYSLGPCFDTSLKWLQNTDLSQLEPGRYDVGCGCYATLQEYETRARDEGRWEAHRQFIDIQCVVYGTEVMGSEDVTRLAVVEPYDASKDVVFLDGDGDFITVREKDFAVFFPQDAHMPTLAGPAGSETVRKIVVKIPVENL